MFGVVVHFLPPSHRIFNDKFYEHVQKIIMLEMNGVHQCQCDKISVFLTICRDLYYRHCLGGCTFDADEMRIF